jgi:alpha-methylacyl-CoA racemase
MAGPLDGLRVIEFVGKGPGPFAAMMLADMGADVASIRRPLEEEPRPDPGFDFVARGRTEFGVDLKSPDGRDVVLGLIGAADALIEGYRPGVMERLGLGPDVCLARNPRLVYGRITGWGQDGGLAPRPGHDINYIAQAGVLGAIGRAGGPPTVPLNLVGDYGGGGMLIAFGIVCGAWEAARSGRGQIIDAAMADGAAVLMTQMFALRAAGQWNDARGTNIIDSGAPYYDVYRTKDGKYVSVGSNERKFFDELMRKLDLDPASVADHRDPSCWPRLREDLERIFASRTRDEWCDLLGGADCCFAPVLSMDEAWRDPYNLARERFVSHPGGAMQPAPAPRFSRTRPELRTVPPAEAGARDLADRWGLAVDVAKQLTELVI